MCLQPSSWRFPNKDSVKRRGFKNDRDLAKESILITRSSNDHDECFLVTLSSICSIGLVPPTQLANIYHDELQNLPVFFRDSIELFAAELCLVEDYDLISTTHPLLMTTCFIEFGVV